MVSSANKSLEKGRYFVNKVSGIVGTLQSNLLVFIIRYIVKGIKRLFTLTSMLSIDYVDGEAGQYDDGKEDSLSNMQIG